MKSPYVGGKNRKVIFTFSLSAYAFPFFLFLSFPFWIDEFAFTFPITSYWLSKVVVLARAMTYVAPGERRILTY